MLDFLPSTLALRLRGLLALALLAVTLSPVALPAATELDHIVAVVNDDVIMRSELDRQVRRLQAQLQQQGTRVPPRDMLEPQLLERLIVVKLQVQLAESTGIRVDDETLNQAMNAIAQDNGVSLSEFRDILERDGYDFAAFREDIRQEITMNRLRQREINNTVTVTDREIANYLATQKQQGTGEAEYRVSHILVAIPPGAGDLEVAEARGRAESILQALSEGADFAETAVARSDGQQAPVGGDLGWRKASELPTLFADEVEDMSPGEVRGLIVSPSGFHIIELSEARSDSGERRMVRQTRAQHILIKPSELVSEAQARTRLEQLRMRIEAGDDFGELARSHSDDRASSVSGGDLGWVSPGDLVPEFEVVMDELAPGEVSAPFTSPFGQHIVRVIDRRTVDSTEEVRRAEAREAIVNRKVAEETEIWMRRLREEAYVEYRIPGLEPLPSES